MTALYSYCETVTAGPLSPWHIRRLTEAGRKPSGGADTPALCGREVAWDIPAPEVTNPVDAGGVCRRCLATYLVETA